jgi:hypothetical protein
MAYTLKIDSYTFAVTPARFPHIEYLWKADGSQVSAKETWPLHCFLVSDDTPSLIAEWNAFKSLIESGAPRDVRWLRDSVEDGSLFKVDHNNTPRFENIRAVNMGGGYVNHVEFTMDAVAVRAIKFPGVIDCEQRNEDIISNGQRQVRTTIRAVGNNARTFVETRLADFISTYGDPATIARREEPFENAYEISAALEPVEQSPGGGQDAFIKKWQEVLTVIEPLQSVTSYGLAAKTPQAPYILRGAYKVGEVRLAGHIEVDTKDGSIPAFLLSLPVIADPWYGFVNSHPEPGAFTNEQYSGPYISQEAEPNKPRTWGLDYEWSAVFGDIERTNRATYANSIRTVQNIPPAV